MTTMITHSFVVLLLLINAAHAGETISGNARVVDGDTLAIGETTIRLQGIDAPETDQVCQDEKAAKWLCGIAARDRLRERIGDRPIDCAANDKDRYGRTLAVCRLGETNLNAWMVEKGYALAFTRYSTAYVPDEAAARDAQRGLWSGAFIAPWAWRHRSKRTVVLGALAVPTTAQAQLLEPASASAAPSPNCIIKGNVSRKGERIYHLPGGLDYANVSMAAPGRRWFCTEDEAVAAGWRRAKR